MNRELIAVIEQIGREKGIDKEVLFDALESALLSASKKTLGAADNVRMHLDRQTGVLHVYGRKRVVTEVTDAKLEISLADAKALNPAAELDDELEQELPPQEFGRIAAQTAIPEIQEAIVLVKAAAREPGERAKVAVASTKRDVDPIGACVGLRGTRIQVISRELRGEKIDIIEWSHDPSTFVSRALSPAKVSSVTIGEPDPEGQASAFVIVPDNQLSLAIGKKGQNARLAAKLTGMRIDIKSESEVEAERSPGDAVPIEDRSALEMLPGVDAALADVLVASGLGSPGAIVRAGREKLGLVAEVGDRADAIFAAAEKLVAAHRAAHEAKATPEVSQPGVPQGDQTPA